MDASGNKTFKDDLADDISIFVETAEFAQEANIDEVILPAQVISHTAKKSSLESRNFDGLHGDFITVYFSSEEYKKARERLPRHGEWIMINGRRYDVLTSEEELGMAKLECAAYRQNTLRGL